METPYPLQTTTDLLRPLTETPYPLRTTIELLRPLTETPYPSTNYHGPTNRLYGHYKTFPARYILHYTA